MLRPFARLVPLFLPFLAACGGIVVVDDTEPDDAPVTAAPAAACPACCTSSADCSPDENACYVGVCSVLGRCLFKPGCLP